MREIAQFSGVVDTQSSQKRSLHSGLLSLNFSESSLRSTLKIRLKKKKKFDRHRTKGNLS
ncbi:hypothetical protein Pint_01358 [Pistacia integerrima]|uniref:Uncharacterized protein n=1 Tax=Pistacia integerrima TaxID=434235 RepID=A0ACC0ZND0_9ROSI|nr:hypothetical protein Pint_01358 [Pistacia integerrima]